MRQKASDTKSISRAVLASTLCLAVLLAVRPARAADEIVVGASLPLSGPLAGFGSFQQWGYKRAVEEANKAGGITVDGKALPVRLIVRNDKTDPNASAGNIETLISREHAVALLGSCTTPLVVAGALVAERHKVPMVTACEPLETFRGVRPWTYVWDLFFDEPDLAHAPFAVLHDLALPTNRKSGSTYLLIDFAIVVIGALGSILGTLLGGVAIGVLQSIGGVVLGDGYRDLVALVAFLLVLALRPVRLSGARA